MNILGIETATERLGAALITGEHAFERFLDSRSSHCELLSGFIGELTTEAGIAISDIDGVAVSIGPGSFTGLRIGIATAMGIAFGLGIQAIGVGTLEAIASRITRPNALVCPMIDAKRREVYTALYRTDGTSAPETIMAPAAVPLNRLGEIIAGQQEQVIITGPAAERFLEPLQDAAGRELVTTDGELAKPSALAIARLGTTLLRGGRGVDPARIKPLYLRRSDAEILRDKQRHS